MKLSKEQVEKNSFFSQMSYDRAKNALSNYENDVDQKQRLEDYECKTCFYLKSQGSLQAFTRFTCKNCQKKEEYHNSNTPRYCISCSEEYECCKRCGSKV